ncbi:hypothetical protein FHR99_001782 [Litorivivens lipolytica]|uniref:Uncharacterized protein n=1 Tax=Litorivivens lipolytica TaxID=1524264 RepID=A0A7W4W4V6_9GAMM|nr:hypothetical protein [Litorivivens lipolytica]MBB3047516.1 hypothetical protein [Litorivivens lipolytica]
MEQKSNWMRALAMCAALPLLMATHASAQPALGVSSPDGGGLNAISGALQGGAMSAGMGDSPGDANTVPQPSSDAGPFGDSEAPESPLPGLASASDDGAEPEPYRFDGGLTVRQETRGEQFTPGSGDMAEARNPSFFERHTVAEDHSSVRTCLAAGETCRAEFDVILATSEESNYDTAVLLNDEVVLPPPQDE